MLSFFGRLRGTLLVLGLLAAISSSACVPLALTQVSPCLDGPKIAERGPPPLHGLDLRMQPLGDSITYGYQSSDGNGYRNYLFTALIGNNNVNLIGSVRAGNMTDNYGEGHSGFVIDQIASAAGLSLPERPNVVLLMAGTNDMNYPIGPDDAPARLSALIDYIVSACPDAVVLVAQVTPAANSDVEARIVTYNSKIPALVDEKQAAGKHVVKVSFSLTTADLKDGLHPNDVGYSKMADGWMVGLSDANAKGWIGKPIMVNNTGKQPCSQNPNWISQGTVAPSVGGQRDEIRFADLTRDGRAEYLWVHADSSVEAWLNLGGPDNGPNAAKVGWLSQGTIAAGVGAPGPEIRFADIDGDGRADYLWLHSDGSVDAWLNLGGPDNGPNAGKVQWQPQGRIATGVGGNGSEIHFADLNGDGRADYLWLHANGSVEAWLNLGGPVNSAKVGWKSLGVIAGGIGKSGAGVQFADINGDGRADYLWIDPTNGAVTAYLNTGGPADGPSDDARIMWTGQGVIAQGVGTDGTGIQFADLNGDGRAEYLSLNAGGAVNAWLNGC